MSFITSIGIAVPPFKLNQQAVADFMERLAGSDEERRKIKTVFRACAIDSRYTVLEDYGRTDDFTFFSNSNGLNPFPSTATRMQAYQDHAVSLSISAIENCRAKQAFNYTDISHLITVSCTGMYAPGLDIDLVNQLGLPTSVNRICLNFMGCFAAISAIKTADAFCRSNTNAKVLIVCTELCSLHFQKEFTDDNILANALFADGAAAFLVEAVPGQNKTLSIEGFHSDILTNGSEHMSWTIGNLGFEMKLSSYVPEVLSHGIKALVNTLTQKVDMEPSDINHFAIHPGGKKILDSVAAELNVSKEKLKSSYEILRQYGNMSSPTILFVLKKIIENNNVLKNDRILGMAFGPGITMESVILKVV